jgi:hypothetical protein
MKLFSREKPSAHFLINIWENKLNALKKFYAEFTGLFVFIIYLFTIAPSVIQIDSGELAAVQSTLGIAHPTGYPLFTILGYLFLQIPLPFTEIFRSNLLAAIWSACGIIFFAKSVHIILNNLPEKEQPKKNKRKKGKKDAQMPEELNSDVKILVSVTSALMLAFSKTFWLQSTSVEVYSLHVFLVILVIYVLLKAYFFVEAKAINKFWYFLAVVLALGFSNHLTTLLILPGIAFLYFSKEKFNKEMFLILIKMLAIFFALLVLIYMYLPLRASQEPILNWGNPIDFERFMRHFTGKQYQVWIFSSMDSAKKQLTYFFSNLPSEFAYVMLLLIAVGIISSYKRFKKIFTFVLISFSAAVIYSINYDIVDIDSYFLLAYISLSFFIAFGIIELVEFSKKKNWDRYLTTGILAILVAVMIAANYNKVNQSGVHTFEDYTKALINSTEENSIIFSYQWDYFLSASYYYQFVEEFRRDVVVIDKELLRRSWYYDQLDSAYPGLLDNQKGDIDLFLKALQPFERSEKFNAQVIEKYFRNIMTGLVSNNIENRNFYIGPEIVENEMRTKQFSLPPGYTIVPHHFLYKVVKGNDYSPAPDPDFTIRLSENKNNYINFIERVSATVLANRAAYELRYNYPAKAKKYVQKIVNDFPSFNLPRELHSLL